MNERKRGGGGKEKNEKVGIAKVISSFRSRDNFPLNEFLSCVISSSPLPPSDPPTLFFFFFFSWAATPVPDNLGLLAKIAASAAHHSVQSSQGRAASERSARTHPGPSNC